MSLSFLESYTLIPLCLVLHWNCQRTNQPYPETSLPSVWSAGSKTSQSPTRFKKIKHFGSFIIYVIPEEFARLICQAGSACTGSKAPERLWLLSVCNFLAQSPARTRRQQYVGDCLRSRFHSVTVCILHDYAGKDIKCRLSIQDFLTLWFLLGSNFEEK